MKNKRIVGAIVAVAIAGGVGVLANVLTTNDASSADAEPTTSKVDAPASPTEIELAPGKAGPVAAGMSKADAIATGLFDADLPAPVEGCPGIPLAWKAPFGATFDVQARGNGEIASIGVLKAGPKTASGLGIGSTYAEVLAAVKDGVAIEAGYDQSGVLDSDAETGGWIGYLFHAPVKDLEPGDKVAFIEITKGAQPGLMRDGC
jgi:hypothetical protein